MRALFIFVMRFFLSIMFSLLVCRIFFQRMPMIKVFGLAIIMLGLAYVLEYFRRRAKREDHNC